MIDLAFNRDCGACYDYNRLIALYDRAYTPLEVLTNQHGSWEFVPIRDRLWIVVRTLSDAQQNSYLNYCLKLGIQDHEGIRMVRRIDVLVNRGRVHNERLLQAMIFLLSGVKV